MPHRIEKINKLLQEEISQILLKEIEFEKVMVTITRVNVSPDLETAKVLITVMPLESLAFKPQSEFNIEEREKKVITVLKRNINDIQKIIKKRLEMKPVPKINFEIDRGMKNLYRIDEIIKHKT